MHAGLVLFEHGSGLWVKDDASLLMGFCVLLVQLTVVANEHGSMDGEHGMRQIHM